MVFGQDSGAAPARVLADDIPAIVRDGPFVIEIEGSMFRQPGAGLRIGIRLAGEILKLPGCQPIGVLDHQIEVSPGPKGMQQDNKASRVGISRIL